MKKALNTINEFNMIRRGDKIVVGLSGGADSVALITLLSNLREKLELGLLAVHVNHGIRGEEAERDGNFARALCKKLGVDFVIRRFDVPKEAGELGVTEEEAGRIVRYRAFYEAVSEYGFNKIAVAHNMNDQAETVLMRLARGSGLTGLKGIRPVRDIIIRPLINCTRHEIEGWLKEIGQEYCTDSTNLKTDYARNKIRLEVIPYLEREINLKAAENIAKTAALVSEEDEFIEGEARKRYIHALEKEGEKSVYLNMDRLSGIETVLLRRVIRMGFRTFKKDIKNLNAIHISQVIGLIGAQSGKSINLPSPFGARAEYGSLVLTAAAPKKTGEYCYALKEGGAVYVPEAGIYVEVSREGQTACGFGKAENKAVMESGAETSENSEKRIKVYTKAFKCDKINETLVVRNRQAGDFITVAKGGGRKKLKDFFIDEKIPREERGSTALIASGSRILWVIGKRQAFTPYEEGPPDTLYIHVWEDLNNDRKN